MASKRGRRTALREEEEQSEIPLSMIDVIFLLLIFFIVCAKFKTQENRLEADLPREGQNVSPPPTFERPREARIKIRKLEDGRIQYYLDMTPCAGINDLTSKLGGLTADPTRSVVIAGKSKVPFKYILAAIDACGVVGITNVKFQALPVEGGGGSDHWYE